MSGNSLPPYYTFLAWVAFLGLVITVVVVYRWRRPERYSRYQLKLTLTLILFLLIPTVPLLFVSGTFVDQLRGLVVALPVDDAMEQGLNVLREVLSEEDVRLDSWSASVLGEQSADNADAVPPDFTIRFERDDDGEWQITAFEPGATAAGTPSDSFLNTPPDPRLEQPQALEDAAFTLDERILFHHQGEGVYMALISPPGGEALLGAGVRVIPEMVDARNALTEGLRSFRMIVRLGGTGTQEFLWIIASFWLVFLTVGAFFASRVLARGVSEPVVELARGMEAVARGNLNTRVETVARDEMQILVDSFNTMTGQIKEAREKIVMAEKQAAWRDVARRIAHEIKNPLTPIQIGLHRVRARLEAEGIWESDPAFQESFRTMNEEVEALRRMAETFSEFAQLPQPERREADLENVVRGAVALFQEGHGGVRLSVDVRGQIPPLSMDPDLVKRALINLVKNAVESAEEAGEGSVDVLIERRGGEVVLQVKDNGSGFDPGEAERLFSPDFTTKTRGTGLGLSIVARIVADHSWFVEAESKGEGTGATVNIRIPLEEVGSR